MSQNESVAGVDPATVRAWSAIERMKIACGRKDVQLQAKDQ